MVEKHVDVYRKTKRKQARVAQLVEHLSYEQVVARSRLAVSISLLLRCTCPLSLLCPVSTITLSSETSHPESLLPPSVGRDKRATAWLFAVRPMELPCTPPLPSSLSPVSVPELAEGRLPAVVVLLVMGLPAAGKSTLIQHLARTSTVLLHHIHVDDLYHQQAQQCSAASATTAGFSPALWHAARDAAFARTMQLLRTLALSALSGSPLHNVLCVDDVFHLRSMRQAYYRLCRAQRVPFHQLLVNTPLATCLSNLATRSAAAAAPATPLPRPPLTHS